ncbi:hypothetical protein BLOT_004712 [Blomia tropicalis]|nr:hypothetical protein BLOT_004712 [Blomia tropicalis]
MDHRREKRKLHEDSNDGDAKRQNRFNDNEQIRQTYREHQHSYRPQQTYDQNQTTSGESSGISSIVANHYNNINNKDISERLKSRIYFMRNFNNWIKSIIIRDTISLIRQDRKDLSDDFVVFDLGCGKGVKFLILLLQILLPFLLNIAKIGSKCMNNKTYTADFINIDCTRERLRNHLPDASLQFDMTSCQFSFHYCFESYEQARMMIQNASESLKIGGIFCGTIPDSNEVMKRLKQSGSNQYGNNLYSITFPKSYDEMVADGIPIFGSRYNFHLDEVVDCPEFLVHFPIFEELCHSFGMKLIFKRSFGSFFLENKDDPGNFQLMNYMDALEKYPPKNNEKLAGTARDDYQHIRDFVMSGNGERFSSLGTLSKSEWQAITLYLVFSFRKVSDGPI